MKKPAPGKTDSDANQTSGTEKLRHFADGQQYHLFCSYRDRQGLARSLPARIEGMAAVFKTACDLAGTPNPNPAAL
ncbi:hypothetical protein [Bradyrhizobium sp. DASA03120]|uniref:hypothetical protein n=1 Tax=Bradyrhizobium sp. SMVTL-02 TaxID=3395917 RepID=UPI003F719FC1